MGVYPQHAILDPRLADLRSLTEYYVGVGSQSPTIQGTYDAAVADGHDEADPAVVIIAPGDYNEAVTLTHPGIHLAGQSKEKRDDGYFFGRNAARIQGPVSVALTTPATVSVHIDGVDMPLDGPAFDVGGAIETYLYVRDCYIGPGWGASAPMPVAYVHNAHANTAVTFQSCVLSSITADPAVWINGNYVDLLDCLTEGPTFGATTSILVDGAAVVYVEGGFVYGTVRGENTARLLSSLEARFESNFAPALNGCIENNCTGGFGHILDDAVFGNNGVTSLFAGTGVADLNYGRDIATYGTNILPSAWRDGGSGYAVSQLAFWKSWSAISNQIDPTGMVGGVTTVAAALAALGQVGVTGSRPGAPATGQPYFDTTLGQIIYWNGAQWVDAMGAGPV